MAAGRPYLLIYDWACGQVVSLAELSDPAAHAEAEAAHAGDAAIEVSVLYAESVEQLRRDAINSRRGRTSSSAFPASARPRR
jgi:hypothetical protein